MSEACGHGGVTSLTPEQFERFMASLEAQKEARAEDMPDTVAALAVMHRAWTRLKELGWKEAIYCPKDGTEFRAIEAGSTGVHDCFYEGDWPKGCWWIPADGDLWPGHPILWRGKDESDPS